MYSVEIISPMQACTGAYRVRTIKRRMHPHATLHGHNTMRTMYQAALSSSTTKHGASSDLMQACMRTNIVRSISCWKHSHARLHGRKHGQDHISQVALPCNIAWAESRTVPRIACSAPMQHCMAPVLAAHSCKVAWAQIGSGQNIA